jgi:hypothetical protein
MPRVGFEPMKTVHALYRAVTVIGKEAYWPIRCSYCRQYSQLNVLVVWLIDHYQWLADTECMIFSKEQKDSGHALKWPYVRLGWHILEEKRSNRLFLGILACLLTFCTLSLSAPIILPWLWFVWLSLVSRLFKCVFPSADGLRVAVW